MYFAYIFFINVRYIHQNILDTHIFDMYPKALKIYFRAKKLYMSHIYFIFMGEKPSVHHY